MCLIVKLPAGHRLTRAHVADTIKYNPDGVGVMYSRGGEQVIRRTMASRADKIIRFLSEVPDDVEYAIHFRRVTRGGRSIHNVHPFAINDRYALMHNGTFDDTLAPVETHKGTSDTQYVVDMHLSQMQDSTLECDAFWSFFEAAVGYNRALVLDRNSGRFRVINEIFWHENADGWLLSNNYSITDATLWGVKVAKPVASYGVASTYGAAKTYTGYTASAPTPAPTPAPAPRLASQNYGVVSYTWIDGIEKDYLSFRTPQYGTSTTGYFYPVSVKLASAFPAECVAATDIMTRAQTNNSTCGAMRHCTATTILLAYMHADENIMYAKYGLLSKAESIVESFVREINGELTANTFVSPITPVAQRRLLHTIKEEIAKREHARACERATNQSVALLTAPHSQGD